MIRAIMRIEPLALAILLGAAISRAETPDWKLVSVAPWQPRDSQAEYAFGGKLWVMGGWFRSDAAPPRDFWSSPDGVTWTKVADRLPILHTDLPMNVVFRGRMWHLGGWYNGRLPGHSASNQVWSSADGMGWEPVTAAAPWSARLAGAALVFRDRLWVLGGTENYYFGDSSSLRNDVWSSADGKEWRLETERAPWSPRAYHQAVVLEGRIYLFGGGNYVPDYQAKNDVWSSADGKEWRLETESAPWAPRLWFAAEVYRGRVWVLGGWAREPDNFGDVWHSADGKAWEKLETKTCWKARHEHSAFVLHDKLWVAGGHARPLSAEVWSLQLPEDFGKKP
jgi:hypothetical protein